MEWFRYGKARMGMHKTDCRILSISCYCCYCSFYPVVVAAVQAVGNWPFGILGNRIQSTL